MNKKYRIIPEDIKLSKVLDVRASGGMGQIPEVDVKAAGRRSEQETEKETVQ